jgi:hypothetical protein
MRLPDVRLLHHRARRFARWTGSIAYRTIVVPLLDRAETEHALDLACRLAADRGARVILVAPAVLERELPLNAHLDGQLRDLKERLEFAATERRAELVVVGAPVESRRGFHHAFPRDVLLLLRETPCRVMIATGPVVGSTAASTRVAPWHDGVARRTSSSAFSGRTRSSPPRTATSARRSTTRSA